ncbi:MAG TPA: M23 family metallopeptidase [Vicinamibacterales bacterium]|nr:M23 family metallopeptidase [Vicinamibacterales bacterium]
MRKQPRRHRPWPIALAAGFLALGMVIGWMAHAYGPPKPAVFDSPVVSGFSPKTPAGIATPEPRIEATSGIVHSDLRVPIDGMSIDAMKGGFAEHRSGHQHEAVDILAPRNTSIHAVADGTIAKLFFSKGGGGNTIYEFDPSGRLCYYYAHLERYADGLRDGQKISKGDVIGYVGTSGNAPPNTPHLHFAVFQLDDAKRWWKGRAIDPYLVFTGG